MTLWSAAVAIVAILAWAYLRSTRQRDQSGPLSAALPQNDPALEREVVELRGRIEVLERIITADSETRRLALDIEALRE